MIAEEAQHSFPRGFVGLKASFLKPAASGMCTLHIHPEEYSPRLIMCTLHTPRGVLQALEKYSSRLMCRSSLPDSLSCNRQSKRRKPHKA
jgi:hypothetical protein